MLRKTFGWSMLFLWTAISSYANFHHYADPRAGYLMALMPVSYVVTVGFLETALGATRVQLFITWTVAAVAAVASYLGLFGFAREVGIPLLVAVLVPVAIDGVILGASQYVRSLHRYHAPTGTPAAPEASTEPVPVEVDTKDWPERLIALRKVAARGSHLNTKELAEYGALQELETRVRGGLNTPEPLPPEYHPVLVPVPDTAPGTDTGPSPDAVLLRERYGSALPTYAVMRTEMGWGSTRVSRAVKELQPA